MTMNIEFLPNCNLKALVIYADDGTATLVSYETPVIRREKDGTYTRLWDSWSVTTGRHISEFYGLKKKDYDKLPVEQ